MKFVDNTIYSNLIGYRAFHVFLKATEVVLSKPAFFFFDVSASLPKELSSKMSCE